MAGQGYVIEAKRLTKRYGQLTAVDSLNLQVREGEIFGLLGPNGAGKTTTILMLLGLTEPSAGQALVCGYDATRNPLAVKTLVGYLPDNVGFYGDLTGRENLRYTARLNHLPPDEIEGLLDRLLHRVGLSGDADRAADQYSRGMRQRLGIADVLVKKPKVIILDEPTLGIDPEGVQQMLDLIRELAREGITVLLSSHLLHQVQAVCDRVGIFVRGRLLAAAPIDSLGQEILKGEVREVELGARPLDEDLQAAVAALPRVESVERRGGLLYIRTNGDLRSALAGLVLGQGKELLHLSLRGASLDDIYRRYFQEEGYHEASGAVRQQ